MTTATEKQAQGFEMTSEVVLQKRGTWAAIVYQSGRCVFNVHGCESQQHAEAIATDIRVRYALVERPTI